MKFAAGAAACGFVVVVVVASVVGIMLAAGQSLSPTLHAPLRYMETD